MSKANRDESRHPDQFRLVSFELEPRIAEEFPNAQLYLGVEPDQGGLSFLQTFAKSPIRKRLKAVQLGPFEDPTELHCDNPAAFIQVWDHHASPTVELPDAMEQQEVEDLIGLAPAVPQILVTGTVAQHDGCELDLQQVSGSLLLRPVAKDKIAYSLEEMLARSRQRRSTRRRTGVLRRAKMSGERRPGRGRYRLD